MEFSTPEKRSGSQLISVSKRRRIEEDIDDAVSDIFLDENVRDKEESSGGGRCPDESIDNDKSPVDETNEDFFSTADTCSYKSSDHGEGECVAGPSGVVKLEDSVRKVNRKLFPAEIALKDKIDKMVEKSASLTIDERIELANLIDMYDDIQEEKMTLETLGVYTDDTNIEVMQENEADFVEYFYFQTTAEDIAREMEEASDDESDYELEPVFLATPDEKSVSDEENIGSPPVYQAKSYRDLGYDPLDDLTDSEDEDPPNNSLVANKESESSEPSTSTSPPSANTDRDENRNLENTKKAEVGDVNKNNRPKTAQLPLEDPYQNTPVGHLSLASYMAIKRWHTVNGHDLNFVGSSLSDGGFDSYLFGPANLKRDRTHSSFIRWTKDDIEAESMVRSKPNAENRARRYELLEKDFEKRITFTAPQCMDLWTFLTEDDGLEDVPYCSDEGWVELLDVYMHMMNHRNQPPPIAFRRIMLQGLRDFPLPFVKHYVYTVMNTTFRMLSPGPYDLFASKFYMEGMTTSLKPGSPDENEAWKFLYELIGTAVSDPDWEEDMLVDEDGSSRAKFKKSDDYDVGDDPRMVYKGSHLLLQFWINVLDVDFKKWHQKFIEDDFISLNGIERPLIARVFFATGEIRWTKRCEDLCFSYAGSIAKKSSQLVRGSIRKLLGLLAQTLSLADAVKDPRFTQEVELNLLKTSLARFVAKALSIETIDNEDLRKELFLLEPSWLSSAASTFYLGIMTNLYFQMFPTLSTIIKNFVDIPLNSTTELDNEHDPDETLENSTQNVDDDETKKTTRSKRRSKSKTPTKSRKNGGDPKLNKRNQYGEYPIHVACRHKDPAKLEELLKLTGVNVNVVDFNDNTPLHEAVVAGNLNSVERLLHYVPQGTIDTFFVPKDGGSAGGSVRKLYVNLLAKNSDGDNPVHYAVTYGRTDILRTILDFVIEQENQNSSHFPNLVTVLTAKSNNVSLLDLTDNQDVKDVVLDYRKRVGLLEDKKEKVKRPDEYLVESIPLYIVQSEKFQLLLRNSLSRYVGANNLDVVYKLWKLTKSDKTYRPANVKKLLDEGKEVPLGKEFERYLPLDFSDSRPRAMFQNVPKCDIHRSVDVQILDLKRFENLVYWNTKLSMLDERNEICHQPEIMFNFKH